MSQPVIHLEEYYLEKILVERTRQATDEITITFDHDYKIKRNADNPHEFALTFIVRNDPEPHTKVYKSDLSITGFFRYNKGARRGSNPISHPLQLSFCGLKCTTLMSCFYYSDEGVCPV